MSDRPHVLLPPSQGKAEGGRRRFRARSGTFASLSASRTEVIGHLGEAVAVDPAPGPVSSSERRGPCSTGQSSP